MTQDQLLILQDSLNKFHFKSKVVLSEKRRSIGIVVYKNCHVKISVPKKVDPDIVSQIIAKKIKWIEKKISHFQSIPIKEIGNKRMFNESTLYYLGDEYQIVPKIGLKNRIILAEDEILVEFSAKSSCESCLKKWLCESASEIFHKRLLFNFHIFSEKYKYEIPTLKIRKMVAKWGSISSRGIMTLNLQLIHTPIECIDYVIMHELCHLKHKNHSADFYALHEYFMPNYKEIKNHLMCFDIR